MVSENDEVEFGSHNVIDSVDRFATNFGLTALAILPTIIIAMAAPWKVAPLLRMEGNSGRSGLVLGPGVFLIVVLVSVIWFSAQVETGAQASVDATAAAAAEQETPQGVLEIGPDAGAAVVEAIRQGDPWRAFFVLLPAYLTMVLVGAGASWLRFVVGPFWTVIVSVRAGFYFFGVMLSVSFGALAVSRAFSLDLIQTQVMTSSVAGLLLGPWMHASFFHTLGDVSRVRAAIAGVLALVSYVGVMIFLTLITQLIS